MSKLIKKRGQNFTKNEQILLLSLVKSYKHVIECKKSGHVTWTDKVNAWKQIQEKFNARSNGEFRQTETLKQKYQNLKKTTKQKFAANKTNLMRTGGGSCHLVEIDDVDESIKELLGDQIEGQPSICDSDMIFIDSNQVEDLNHGNLIIEKISNNQDNSETLPLPKMNGDAIETPAEIIHNTNAPKESKINTNNQNWGTYCPGMLKTPKNTKLQTKTERSSTPKKKARRLAFKRNKNEQLVSDKISFLALQKKLLLKEHKLKMKILEYDYALKKKKAEALGLSLISESEVQMSEESSDEN